MTKQSKRVYCQPLNLNRLNLWLWLSCLLFLGIILQLEMTDAVSWPGLVLAALFLLLAGYVFFGSFVLLEPDRKQLSLHYPFSRQGLVIQAPQYQVTATGKRVLVITSKSQTSYRFWLTAKRRQQVLKFWEELN